MKSTLFDRNSVCKIGGLPIEENTTGLDQRLSFKIGITLEKDSLDFSDPHF